MKKFLLKYIHLLIGIIVLTAIGIYGFINTELIESVSSVPIYFQIETGAETTDISLYKADDEHYYVFLPSYADMKKVRIIIPSHTDISLGGIPLYSSMDCSSFETETEYELVLNNQTISTLQFFCSANVATMYINTATGSMERIHNDQEYEEPSSMILVTENGTLNYLDANISLKGRGNATWNYDKKPYSLALSSEGNLLGMGSAVNWILLANSTDETNLRNKLAYDLAAQTDFQWSPECRYVDLYLNGRYNGLYLLSERIEAGANRLDIDTDKGDFLCKIDLGTRSDTLRNSFETPHGRTIEITLPKTLTSVQENRIHELVRKMEETIIASTDSGSISGLDLDSWVCRYLIDEISANADSDLASSYFYYTDGTFHAGPIWDYDNSFGNSIRSANARAFTAKNAFKASYYPSPYYASLYENEMFYSRMIELYQSDFLPLLNRWLDTEIYSLSKEIASASQMNSIRWYSMFEKTTSDITTTEALLDYLRLRVDFLNSAWLDQIDYCTVQIETVQNGSYLNVSVIKGECLDTSFLDAPNTTWIIAETEDIFDIDQPIIEDITLKALHNQ